MSKKKDKEDAFLALLKENELRIYKVCRQYSGGDNELVSDLFNEVVLRLWEEYGAYGLFRFRRESHSSTWVYQIACNTVKSYNKRYAMQNRVIRIDTEMADVIADVEELTGLDAFGDLVDTLGELDKKILERYLAGESYLQIADALAMKEGTVGTRMSRIVKKMKKQINNNNE